MSNSIRLQPETDDLHVLEDVVGYLNFSSGKRDVKFLDHLNQLWRKIEGRQDDGPGPDSTVACHVLCQWMHATVDRLERAGGPFVDSSQARSVVRLLEESLLPAYREFHFNLLHHQTESSLWRPFFVGLAIEALLLQGSPWDETERITRGAIALLNDFVGYRPVPTLESLPSHQPYDHEFVRPIPLYIEGAGVATGRYEPIIRRALEILRDTDPDILAQAWFDLDRLEEVALDPRAYDFDHPVNRRPNYHFGQWDPRHISGSGYYTRFVLQEITLDALLMRCEPGDDPDQPSADELLTEAAAVLAGTMLMASGTSGNSPDCHDSSTTLSTLLPHIAAYRDDFYKHLLGQIEGPHRQRLLAEAERLRQPLAGARQHLNRQLARRRAMQLQRVHLAHMYARMGYPDAAIEQVDSVQVASARMICKIYCHLTAGHNEIDQGRLDRVVDHLAKTEKLIHRAIDCGAIVDPWNVVGFAANFSLFPALENTVHDWRVDELVDLVEQTLDLAARAWSEAAAVDDGPLEEQFSSVLARMSGWWDQFATYAVEDVRPLMAKEVEISANLVAGALNAWHKSGAASGDIAFWRLFVEQFDTPKAFQMVIEALLDHGDTVAAQALMMQWVSQKDRTPLQEGDSSFHRLALRWLAEVETQEQDRQENRWDQVARFFAFLEANAEEYWQVPDFRLDGTSLAPAARRRGPDDSDTTSADRSLDDFDPADPDDPDLQDDLADAPMPDDIDDFEDDYQYDDEYDDEYEYDYDEEDDEDDHLFRAAYEEMTFRGSSEDGVEGETIDDGTSFDPLRTEWEEEARRLEQRIDFLTTVARLWKHASIIWSATTDEHAERREVFDGWIRQAATTYHQLVELLETLHRYRFMSPSGTHDSLVEFDRLRTIREILIQRILTTCVETCDAARLMLANRGVASAEEVEWFGQPIDTTSVCVLRAVLAGDAEAVRTCWGELIATLLSQPLLYIPHARGGKPRNIVAARVLQQLMHDLLGWLPQLGLVRETCQLLDVAQQMEINHPVGRGAVTEFDRLFENGYQAIVRSIAASAEDWQQRKSLYDPSRVDHMLTDALQRLTEKQLDHWLNHSHTLRLSVVEKLAEPDKWQRFVAFVQRYGRDLFTQKFLSLGNLRGILHQGTDLWLKKMGTDPDAVDAILLLQEIGDRWPRDEAAELLSIAIEAVVENYREYRDYNTTTTQSDHGELLYMLIGFLRVRAAYDRVAWNLKPVVWSHEILVRQGRIAAAEMWCQALEEKTAEAADLHWQSLQAVVGEYGMQLTTVADRLGERFVRPLLIDRVCSLVEPAMTADSSEGDEAFQVLETEIAAMADEPSGAGLDLPDWLVALEDEVTAARSRMNHTSSAERLAHRIGQVRLSWKDLIGQLEDAE